MEKTNIRDELMHSNGTTPLETFFTIFPAYLYTFITTSLMTIVICNTKLQFFLEFFTLIIPIVLSVTVLSEYVVVIDILFCIISILLALSIKRKKITRPKEINEPATQTSFLTNIRSSVNVISVIAILAVDFKIFPRKFAKTETFGYSLMDVGVGLFIYTNAVVTPEVLNKKSTFSKIIKNNLPLLILGFIRLYSTKQLDYHVPVTEYGVHWNFFFTLLFTKTISSFLCIFFHIKYMFIVSTIILILHEYLLQTVFQEIVLSNAPRIGLFYANREGISSVLGYVSLYLYGMFVGYVLDIKSLNAFNKNNYLLWTLFSSLFFVVNYILTSYFSVSRLLVNSSYVFWILLIGTTLGKLFAISDKIQIWAFNYVFREIKAPLIYRAINYNALVFFLIGNLLTGCINILCDTLSVSSYIGFFIILCYIFVLCIIMLILYENKIKLKL